MPVTVKPIRLQPKQQQLYDLVSASGPDVSTWIGYGGARGGSKSRGVRNVMVARRHELPGTPGYIIRRNYPELYENHIVKFQQEFPDLSLYYNAAHKEYTLPNGSRIAFKYADNTEEIRRMSRGPEAVDIFIDQAEQFTHEELLMLHAPNRWPSAGPGVCKTGLFFNPGGAGTEFLRRVFWLKDYLGDENPRDFTFIQAFGWDNYEWFRGEVDLGEVGFYRMPGMCARCEREKDRREDGVTRCCRFQMFISETSEGRKYWAYPPSMRLGELFGSFESFAGQYFAGVWDESAIVLPASVADRLIKPWWTRWVATDWGFAHYACHLWFASGKVGPRELREVLNIESDLTADVVVVYRELVVRETAEAELAERIVEMTPLSERDQIRRHFMSPDAWAKRGSANTVAEQISDVLRSAALPAPVPADNDRIGGWRLLYDGFRRALKLGTRDEAEAPGYPALLVSANCPQVISSVPLLVRDPKRLEDVQKIPGALSDDVGDCLRYGHKSMLEAMPEAPRSVRRQEIYYKYMGQQRAEATYAVVDGVDSAMTSMAMAMRKFEADERSRHRRVRRRR